MNCQFCNKILTQRSYTDYPYYNTTCLHCPIQVSYQWDYRYPDSPLSHSFLLFDKGNRYNLIINNSIRKLNLVKQGKSDSNIMQLFDFPDLNPKSAPQFLKKILKMKVFL